MDRMKSRRMLRDARSLERQLSRGPPGVYQAVIAGHRESPSVRVFGGTERPGVTGDGTTRQLPITRNEGVPGSSPGVGFFDWQGFLVFARERPRSSTEGVLRFEHEWRRFPSHVGADSARWLMTPSVFSAQRVPGVDPPFAADLDEKETGAFWLREACGRRVAVDVNVHRAVGRLRQRVRVEPG
jgi:hypothetical protein